MLILGLVTPAPDSECKAAQEEPLVTPSLSYGRNRGQSRQATCQRQPSPHHRTTAELKLCPRDNPTVIREEQGTAVPQPFSRPERFLVVRVRRMQCNCPVGRWASKDSPAVLVTAPRPPSDTSTAKRAERVSDVGSSRRTPTLAWTSRF